MAKGFEKLPVEVLFVEDERLMRDSIAEILRRRVRSVLVADNGEIGLELFKQHRPEVVLTDIRMPVMTGLEMLQEIREIDDSTKVIVISAHSDTEYFQQAINLGVDGFLLKPVNVDTVIKQIVKVTRQLLYQQKAQEFEEKFRSLNDSIFQNKTRAAYMQSSMAPSWLLSEKKILFSSNYIVDENTPSGDFFDIIPITETRYIAYLGHFPHQDIRGTLFLLTIKMTLDTIIKNELEHASPGVIIDRLKGILGSQEISDDMELMVLLIDSDFEFVRFARLGSQNILQYDTKQKIFCPLIKLPESFTSEKARKPKTSCTETEFSFDRDKLTCIFSRNLKNYQRDNKKLGLDGIKSIISEIEEPDVFLLPYLFRDSLSNGGYSFPTADFSFLLFSTNYLRDIIENCITFTFKSVLTNTAHIRKKCELFVREKTGFDELSFSVELVISELITNVIVHGLKNRPDTMVVLTLEISDQLVIRVWDKGLTWDIPQINKEEAFDNVKLDATSGRGLPIIISLSNKIERVRIDSINQTKVFFNIEPEKE
jgi:DNA-binding NarL/FixJ family response regulator/anti-sigma regulatory factor (Ser/Thr protein kinase)